MEEISVPAEQKQDVSANQNDEQEESIDDITPEMEFEGVPPVRERSVKELMDEANKNQMVQEAIDLFGGKLTDVFENN